MNLGRPELQFEYVQQLWTGNAASSLPEKK